MNYMSRVTTRASRNVRLRHRSIAHARAREETEQKRKSARDNEGGIDSFSMNSLKNSFFCVTRIHLLSMKAFMNSRTTKCCECESAANVLYSIKTLPSLLASIGWNEATKALEMESGGLWLRKNSGKEGGEGGKKKGKE